MIKVHAVRIDGTPVPDSTETFSDMAALRQSLANTATADYAERVIQGLESPSSLTIPNGPRTLDVWEFA